MVNILIVILGLGLCIQAFVGLAFFISSIWEKEKRASVLGGLQFLGMLVLLLLFFVLNTHDFFDSGVGFGIMILALIIGIASVIIFFLRIGANPKALQGTKGFIVGAVKRWDERDIQFSNMMRMMYMMMKTMPPPGTQPAASDTPAGETAPNSPPEAPELQFGGPGVGPPPAEMMEKLKDISDEEMNAAGLGPLGPAPDIGKIDGPSGYPLAAMTNAAAAIQASFTDPALFAPKVLDHPISITPEVATLRVKGYTRHLGAVLVGITELHPNWIYSHRGVSELHLKQWGKEVDLDHKYAIVFAEEMDRELINPGPHSPIVMESMTNYAKGAFIGMQLATFIANMGYPARANFGAHYDTLMVPLAVDAGLGELSRMGYLISKGYGPRIRLSAVTTNLPVIPDKPVDIGVRHFCTICKKCAHCCPSQSIPLDDDPVDVNGSLRWKLNDLTCFMYWQQVGTDCGVCMRVCPWAHARTFPHKIIVEAVTRNKYSRLLFNTMDDVFYGKKPRPKDPPEWANFRTGLRSRPPTEEELEMFSGTWKLTLETPLGADTLLIIMREEDGSLRGTMDGKMGKPALEDIRIGGKNFSFKAALKSPMGTMKFDYTGTVEGDTISGNFFSPVGPTQFTGERQQ